MNQLSTPADTDSAFEARCERRERRLDARLALAPRSRCRECGATESAAWVRVWGNECRECGGRLEVRA